MGKRCIDRAGRGDGGNGSSALGPGIGWWGEGRPYDGAGRSHVSASEAHGAKVTERGRAGSLRSCLRAAPMTYTFGTLENVVGQRRNITVFFLVLFFSLLKTHHFPLLSAACHNNL